MERVRSRVRVGVRSLVTLLNNERHCHTDDVCNYKIICNKLEFMGKVCLPDHLLCPRVTESFPVLSVREDGDGYRNH
jgi:hypothetical protein